MPVELEENNQAEQVTGRVLAWGKFCLRSAAHFGSGQGAEIDMMLARDANGALLIPGSSIAGVCRSYLTYCWMGKKAFGYLNRNGETEPLIELDVEKANLLFSLFGGEKDEGNQSALIVYDAIHKSESLSVRDGVKIDLVTGQAEDTGKYDFEVVERGTEFLLRFELVLRRGEGDMNTRTQNRKLKAAFNFLLEAFENEEIRLGAKTRRGLGRGKMEKWYVQDLDFEDNPAAVLTWLNWSWQSLPTTGATSRANTEAEVLGSGNLQAYFDLEATFDLTSSLLIRSYSETLNKPEPDAVQIMSSGLPVVPGTSAGGVVHHQAERIARTLAKLPYEPDTQGSKDKVSYLIDQLFGFVDEKERTQQAGRLRVEEELVQVNLTPLKDNKVAAPVSEIQTRIRIDRFTGGTLSGYLFEEKPLWNARETPLCWKLRMRLWEPRDEEIGLLLHVLKDMWVGDLTIGGGKGIGRGVLRGVETEIRVKNNNSTQCGKWRIHRRDDNLDSALIIEKVEGEANMQLENYADALWSKLVVEQ